MYHKTRGIVFHTIKYSETSVISKIYTEKLGLQSYMVKGVRTARSKTKAAMLQPLTLLDLEVSHRENKQLQYIKELKRGFVYQSLPFDTLKSAISLFLLEVIAKAIREHEPNEEMFEFIYEALCALDRAETLNPDFHLLFLLHFSRYLGFAPSDNYSEHHCYFDLSEGMFVASQGSLYLGFNESLLLSRLLQTSLFDMPTLLKTARAERQQLLKGLLKYYQLHLENFSLKSPEVLEAVLG